ncbi:MAG: hypothetical protein KC475_09980, partial [Cyanobacteria bacterium HKST-UBA03]|nr:hypothetical protein [Cyanobacteria bacterium HKST-UBA03]
RILFLYENHDLIRDLNIDGFTRVILSRFPPQKPCKTRSIQRFPEKRQKKPLARMLKGNKG